MWPNPQFPADLVTFIEEILNRKLHFLCSGTFHNISVTEIGFAIHPTKSIIVPKQKITFLGFEMDTLNMTLTLTCNKKDKIRNVATTLLPKQSCSIRTLASFLGNIISSFEAVPNGKLFYRNIEQLY